LSAIVANPIKIVFLQTVLGDGAWNVPYLAFSSLITLGLYSPLLATGSFIVII